MRLPVALMLLLAALPGRAAEQATPERPLRVLLLFSSEVLLPGALEQNQVTQQAIRESVPRDLQFFSEGMDAIRLPGVDQENEFVALLLKRYATYPPDLVVAHGPMQDFITRRRAALWPDVPWMFVGVVAREWPMRDLPPDLPGLSVRFDTKATIELALRMQPDAKRVVVIAGTAPYDQRQLHFARPILDEFSHRLEIQYLPAGPLEEMKKAAAALTPDTILLTLSMMRDGEGRLFASRDSMREIIATAGAPAYSYFSNSIGLGAVGGVVADFEAQKPMIGAMARELLLGEPRKVSLQFHPPLAPTCVVDWRALQRFDLPLSRLPADCEVQHRDRGFLRRYLFETLAVALVVLIQAGLIIALLAQNRRRKRAEEEMNLQRRQLAHAGRLAAIGELSASIAHEINQPLGAILNNAEAGETLAASGRSNAGEMQQIFAAIRADDLRASAVIDRMRKMSRRGPVEHRSFDLNEAVLSIVRLTEGMARSHGVTVATELESALPAVKGDFVQMQQVLLNLLLNAIDAVSDVDRTRRTVTIRTGLHGKDAVEVTVRDGGHGIPDENLSRVFEPFYSSKPDGLGLGLSISRSIVHAHRGRIWAENHGAGASFRFSIPV